MDTMSVTVRRDFCVGNGNCVRVAPEVFALEGSGPAEVLTKNPSDDLREQVEEAEAFCPTDAIEVIRL